MFRKVAIALVAASMLTAPVMVQAATSKPATTSSTAVKTVKADTTAVKHKKHVRAHHRARVAHHKHMNGVKHARHHNMNGTKHVRHFNKGNGHKVAGASGKVVSAKPATRSN
jgi:hypothetical protein